MATTLNTTPVNDVVLTLPFDYRDERFRLTINGSPIKAVLSVAVKSAVEDNAPTEVTVKFYANVTSAEEPEVIS